MVGIVKWFNDEKGYGFIQVEGHADIFVHYRGIKGAGRRKLDKGDEVEFTAVQNPDKQNKMQAENVVIVRPFYSLIRGAIANSDV